MTRKYRFEDVQIAKVNGKNVKLFKAFEYSEEQNAYVFVGQFEAPAKTAIKNLANYIIEEA